MRWPWSRRKATKLDFGCVCSVLVVKYDADARGNPAGDAYGVTENLESMFNRELGGLRWVTAPNHIEIQVLHRFSPLVHICTLQGEVRYAQQ